VRAWIRGFHPLLLDPRPYFSTVPMSETKAAGDALAAWEQTSPLQVSTSAEDGS
jgi:hypothetical protein